MPKMPLRLVRCFAQVPLSLDKVQQCSETQSRMTEVLHFWRRLYRREGIRDISLWLAESGF